MKLYKLPRGAKFKLLETPQTPPASLDGDIEETYEFLRVDGMYCNCLNSRKQYVYFAAWTEVSVLE